MLQAPNGIQSTFNPMWRQTQATASPQQSTYAIEQDRLSSASPTVSGRITLLNWIFSPFLSHDVRKNLLQNPQSREPLSARIGMYKNLHRRLSSKGKKYLRQLLKSGKLTNTKSDDNRSTLYHLYSIANSPRAEGYDANDILEHTLRLMNESQTITQKFSVLDPKTLASLMHYYKQAQGSRLSVPVNQNMLRVVSSATCVAASVMGYLADKTPSEFARHIHELTSPAQAFYEKAWAHEISPENPQQASQVLQEYKIPAQAIPGSNGSQFWIKADLPYGGKARALNAQNNPQKGKRNSVEAAYQAALIHLVVRSYSPGLDMRVQPDGTLDPVKGLEEDYKTLMESIVKDNGGVMSVTYQFTASDRNEDVYLVGYYRDFNKTTQDLMKALHMGEQVIIGITDTDKWTAPGQIVMGHELRVVGYRNNPKTNEIEFKIVDTDDNNPKYVYRKASEIVPKIHHAGFPVKLAKQITKEVESTVGNHYLMPDSNDAQRFKLLATVPPEKQKAFLDDYQRMVQEEEAQLQAQQGGTPQSNQQQAAYSYNPNYYWYQQQAWANYYRPYYSYWNQPYTQSWSIPNYSQPTWPQPVQQSPSPWVWRQAA